ncbi:MAG: hypothetical protein IPF63_13635 [Bacteroidetes bacterium]|nr:hypothetical protein [Bacteroidota bacterium]
MIMLSCLKENFKRDLRPRNFRTQLYRKGNFGQILEKFYFGYNPNSKSEADFFEIGMELKTSPLKQLKNDEYRSKERLVLNIINYIEVVNQQFEERIFGKRMQNLFNFLFTSSRL